MQPNQFKPYLAYSASAGSGKTFAIRLMKQKLFAIINQKMGAKNGHHNKN